MERTARYQDNREKILSVGEGLILGRGFSAMGLSELLNTAEVPKGSFYHYFLSKEGFGVALLERYFERYRTRLVELFGNTALPARVRLLTYFDSWRQVHASSQCHHTCLAVKLAAEVSDLSEPMREALATGMDGVIDLIAGAILAAQKEGTVYIGHDPQELAESLYAMWLGASLRGKAKRNINAMDIAYKQTEWMLGGA
jgi:TetR/AcrR family transcriptional regulator, transcriptional repressor for nem operon